MAKARARHGSTSLAAPSAKRPRTGGKRPPERTEPAHPVVQARADRFVEEHVIRRQLPDNWKAYYIVVKGKVPGIYRYWYAKDARAANAPIDEAAETQTSGSLGALFKKSSFYEDIKEWTILLEERRPSNDPAISISSSASASAISRANPPPSFASASSFTSASPLASASSTAPTSAVVSPAPKWPEAGDDDFIPLVDDEDEPDAGQVEVERPKGPELCQEQQEAVDLAMKGHNLFITGSGGCGKSVLVKALHEKFTAIGRAIHLLAPTGQAVVNINGRTTLNYAGWGIDWLRMTRHELVEKSRKKPTWTRILTTKVLIIDEISMVENLFFTRLSGVMSDIRDDPRPFGGVQMIVVGDFCQLPPVLPFFYCPTCGQKNNRDRKVYYFCKTCHKTYLDEDKWVFKSPEWQRCRFQPVHLTTIHRQQDEAFIKILQKCRRGEQLHAADCDLLLNHRAEVSGGVCLFGKNVDVDNRNAERLQTLPGEELEYECKPWLVKSSERVKVKDLGAERYEFKKSCRLPEILKVKVGMPVMLLANVDLESGLCNGSQGIVCGFAPRSRLEAPSRPHSNNYEGDDNAFRVALCRYRGIRKFDAEKFPEVRFNNGLTRVIGPECAVAEVGATQPSSLDSRTQIPLAPAWAMTIHKSQSLTMDRVIVDLSKTFEKGQAYVAISRARSLQGLRIEPIPVNILRSQFEVDCDVMNFMKAIGLMGEGNEDESESDVWRELVLNS